MTRLQGSADSSFESNAGGELVGATGHHLQTLRLEAAEVGRVGRCQRWRSRTGRRTFLANALRPYSASPFSQVHRSLEAVEGIECIVIGPFKLSRRTNCAPQHFGLRNAPASCQVFELSDGFYVQ